MLQQKPVQRIANFGSSLVHSTLCCNFTHSIFSCATFNLGRQTIMHKHTDHLNLPFGWCHITALSDFNPKQGGHLVLSDLRMVIGFLPGSTILIPSTILRHANTPISASEHYYSFTQFSPGGIFYLNRMGPTRWEEGLGMLSTWSELRSTPA
ncbi:hypothetical protein C8Q73DRAFT_745015 [Cubamyces lactineus]|nr:hypothetical protein C8Q73DRAFT_745015 [Cubamyces lactineus]